MRPRLLGHLRDMLAEREQDIQTLQTKLRESESVQGEYINRLERLEAQLGMSDLRGPPACAAANGSSGVRGRPQLEARIEALVRIVQERGLRPMEDGTGGQAGGLESRVAALEECITNSESNEQLRSMQRHMDQLREQLHALENARATVQSEADRWHAEADAARQEVIALRQQVAVSGTSEKSPALREVEELRVRLKQAVSEASMLRSQLGSREADASRLERRVTELLQGEQEHKTRASGCISANERGPPSKEPKANSNMKENGGKVLEDTLYWALNDSQLQGPQSVTSQQSVASQQSTRMTGQLSLNSMSNNSLDKQNFLMATSLRREGSQGNALSSNFPSSRGVAVAPPQGHSLPHRGLDATQRDGPSPTRVVPPTDLRSSSISRNGLSGELSPPPPMHPMHQMNVSMEQSQGSRSQSVPVQVRGMNNGQTPPGGCGGGAGSSAGSASLARWAASPTRERSMTPPPPRSVTPPSLAGNCTPLPPGVLTPFMPPPHSGGARQSMSNTGLMPLRTFQSTTPRTPAYPYGAGLVPNQMGHLATMRR